MFKNADNKADAALGLAMIAAGMAGGGWTAVVIQVWGAILVAAALIEAAIYQGRRCVEEALRRAERKARTG